jgi:molybdenum-dependent DNA-binding transcriptional regulator ModE
MPGPRPRVIFVSDGQEITHRQMEALAALHSKGSMKKAAEFLGLSTPVLHKYIHEVENKSGLSLVTSTSRGSKLNAEGVELLSRFRAYEMRLDDHPEVLKVAGTVVSETTLLTAATILSDAHKQVRVIISTDEENIRLAEERRVDAVVLDDAAFAMERAPDMPSSEIGSDMLVLRDSGSRYAKLAFGAQRLGFRYLTGMGIPFEIDRIVYEPRMVDHTDLSYVANKSLVRSGRIGAAGAKDQTWSLHSIVALQCSEHEDLPMFLDEARDAWIYRKG